MSNQASIRWNPNNMYSIHTLVYHILQTNLYPSNGMISLTNISPTISNNWENVFLKLSIHSPNCNRSLRFFGDTWQQWLIVRFLSYRIHHHCTNGSITSPNIINTCYTDYLNIIQQQHLQSIIKQYTNKLINISACTALPDSFTTDSFKSTCSRVKQKIQ